MILNTIRQNIYRKANGQKQRCGLLVSVIDDTAKKVYIGYALCMKGDKFSQEMAEKIAYGRAFKRERLTIPQSILKDVDKFIARTARYYKDCELGTEILEPSVFKAGKE